MAILFVTVVLKLASSPKAAANSFNVFKAEGELSTKFDSAVVTYAVVAIFVLLSDADCVLVVGLPPSAKSSAIICPFTFVSAIYLFIS